MARRFCQGKYTEEDALDLLKRVEKFLTEHRTVYIDWDVVGSQTTLGSREAHRLWRELAYPGKARRGGRARPDMHGD